MTTTKQTADAPIHGAAVEFIDVLKAMPELWGRLLTEHQPDPTGKRCRACTTAGTGSPGAAWPCRIRDAAESARARYLTARAGRPVALTYGRYGWPCSGRAPQ